MIDEIEQEELVEEEIDLDQYLVFNVSSQEYGFKVAGVREISTLLATTEVPNAPPYIEGIMNLRGRLASVISFHKKLGFEPKEHDEDTRVIILEHRGFPIGVVVDNVEEVIRIPEEKIQKAPEATTTSTSQDYIAGVGLLDERLIILLDTEGFLTKAEWIELDAITKIADKARKVQEGTEKTEAEPPAVEKGGQSVKHEQSDQVKVEDAKPRAAPAARRSKRAAKTT